MAILEILEFPDPRLRKIAAPVTEFNDELKTLVANMTETMYEAEGIGLAATQVDVHLQIIVIDISESREEPLVFINPRFEVIDSDLHEYREGCLSVPGYYEDIKRPKTVKVSAVDVEGNAFEIEPDGLLAVCIQHEMDHLKGKLFVDYLSTLKRNRIKQRIQKEKRSA